MNKGVYIICLLAAVAIIFAMRDGCQKPSPATHIDSTSFLKAQINDLRQQLKGYDARRYTDTIQLIAIKYRERLDTVRLWAQANNSWDSVCKIAGAGSNSELDCMRLLLSDHIRAEYQDTLLAIYRLQRSEDSMQIGYLMQLDSLNSVALISTQTELDKARHQTKGERLKQEVKIALSAIVGFLVGRL